MTYSVWPASLPEFVQEGAQETLSEDFAESAIGHGGVNTRRRSSALAAPFSATIVCTLTQVRSFETFYRDTLAGGALRFTWVHPGTQDAATFKFLRPPPVLSAINNDTISIAMKLMQVA